MTILLNSKKSTEQTVLSLYGDNIQHNFRYLTNYNIEVPEPKHKLQLLF